MFNPLFSTKIRNRQTQSQEQQQAVRTPTDQNKIWSRAKQPVNPQKENCQRKKTERLPKQRARHAEQQQSHTNKQVRLLKQQPNHPNQRGGQEDCQSWHRRDAELRGGMRHSFKRHREGLKVLRDINQSQADMEINLPRKDSHQDGGIPTQDQDIKHSDVGLPGKVLTTIQISI